MRCAPLFLLWALALAGPVGAQGAAAQDAGPARTEIARQRADQAREHAGQEARCYQRFAVEDCLRQVRAQARAQERQLRAQEELLDAQQRRERAQLRQQDITQRQRAQHEREGPPAPVQSRERQPAAQAAPPAQGAQPRQAQRAQAQQERRSALQRQAAQVRERHEAQLQRAEERRVRRAQRMQEKTDSGKPVPAPLPGPAAPAVE